MSLALSCPEEVAWEALCASGKRPTSAELDAAYLALRNVRPDVAQAKFNVALVLPDNMPDRWPEGSWARARLHRAAPWLARPTINRTVSPIDVLLRLRGEDMSVPEPTDEQYFDDAQAAAPAPPAPAVEPTSGAEIRVPSARHDAVQASPPRVQPGMSELEALHLLVQMKAEISPCDASLPRKVLGGNELVPGHLVSVRGRTLWAPSILDAAIAFKMLDDAHELPPHRSVFEKIAAAMGEFNLMVGNMADQEEAIYEALKAKGLVRDLVIRSAKDESVEVASATRKPPYPSHLMPRPSG